MAQHVLRLAFTIMTLLSFAPLLSHASPQRTTDITPQDITSTEIIVWFQSLNDVLYYATPTTLYRTDNSVTTSTPLASGLQFISTPVPFGTKFFFTASTPASGTELWISDGSSAGTIMVQDIAPAAESSSPSFLSVLGNKLIFVAISPNSGSETWVSDGTSAGTQLLLDSVPGTDYGRSPWSEQVVVGNQLYFTAGDYKVSNYGTPNYENVQLWRTDGTIQGTILVKDRVNPTTNTLKPIAQPMPAIPNVPTPSPISTISGLVASASGLYFYVQPDNNTRTLWHTNGSLAGTVLLQSFPSSYHRADLDSGIALFCVFENGSYRLWRSDSTPAGTYRLPSGCAGTLAPLQQGLYTTSFSANESAGLWYTDGTVAGTYEIRRFAKSADILPDLGPLKLINGKLYFSVTRFSALPQVTHIWRTDGTAQGTVVTPFPAELTLLTDQPFPGVLLFFSDSTSTTPALWASDGTLAGTRQVAAIGSPFANALIRYQAGLATIIRDGNGDSIRLLPGPAAAFMYLPSLIGATPGASAAIPITYATNGAAASGVSVSVTLPAGVTYLDDTAGVAPSVNGSTLTWSLPDLPTLATGSFQVRVQMPDGALGTRFPLSATMATTTAGASPAQANATGELMRAAIVSLPQILVQE
jgi:ELWxxDGT repeat protein